MKSTFERICARPIPGLAVTVLGFGLIFFGSGCAKKSNMPPPKNTAPAPASLALILAPHEGTQEIDREIRRYQEIIRSGKPPEQSLERLGWLFVNKARATFDSGFYKIAEQCGLELSARQP